jgi:outer membrane protein
MISNQITLMAKKEGFNSGMFPSLAVTDAERDLYQTKQEYAKSQYEYILYSLRLKKAVGLLTEEDISTVNSWLK